MRAPKILPWIASKAGIHEDLALKLWRRAAGESELLCGNCASPDYYGAAIARFLDLVEGESKLACADLKAGPREGWVGRQQKHMSLINKVAAQNTYRFWQANWGSFLSAQRTSV